MVTNVNSIVPLVDEPARPGLKHNLHRRSQRVFCEVNSKEFGSSCQNFRRGIASEKFTINYPNHDPERKLPEEIRTNLDALVP